MSGIVDQSQSGQTSQTCPSCKQVADVLKTAITQGNAQQQKRNTIISNIPMIGSVLERKARFEDVCTF